MGRAGFEKERSKRKTENVSHFSLNFVGGKKLYNEEEKIKKGKRKKEKRYEGKRENTVQKDKNRIA